MLRLSSLDSDGMTDDKRDAFVNMAENLGIEPGEAEDLVDLYLEETDRRRCRAAPPKPSSKVVASRPRPQQPSPRQRLAAPDSRRDMATERARLPEFRQSASAVEMLFVPSGDFSMGSEAPDAAPNERPLTQVTLSRFYMSRFPITNAQYEQFDPSHVRNARPGAGDRHPVVYVSSLEAMKFCQWLTRARTEDVSPADRSRMGVCRARARMAANIRGAIRNGRGDLANFADRNTVFAWSDREIDDGFAESSPVGAFPLGRVHSAWKTWRGTSGNGASIIWKPIAALPR